MWYVSLTKLWGLSLTACEARVQIGPTDCTDDRVLMIDSDSIVQHSLDHLFEAPLTDLALSRAYWNDQQWLNSQLILAVPSEALWQRVLAVVNSGTIFAALCARAGIRQLTC